MQEIWRSVKGYEGLYEVSSFGRVKCLAKMKGYGKTPVLEAIMKQRVNRGYYFVALSKGGRKTTRIVNKLVAEAFLPNPEGKPYTNHKDNNPSNNHVDNLEWCTQKENYEHSKRQGRNSRGERHGNSKLTEEAVIRIRECKKGMKGDTNTLSSLCRELGIGYETAKRIRRGESWQHVS